MMIILLCKIYNTAITREKQFKTVCISERVYPNYVQIVSNDKCIKPSYLTLNYTKIM